MLYITMDELDAIVAQAIEADREVRRRASREYSKAWVAANPERHKAATARWRAANLDAIRRANAKQRMKDPQRHSDRTAVWQREKRANDPEWRERQNTPRRVDNMTPEQRERELVRSREREAGRIRPKRDRSEYNRAYRTRKKAERLAAEQENAS